MTSRRKLLLLLGLLSATGACASVKNYDKSGKNLGFEHFSPKYYMVVEATKEGGREVKILTLPDVSNPRYVKHRAGWGKAEFNFKLANGVLSEFGQKAESGAPEAVTGLAALATAYGGILTAEAAKMTASQKMIMNDQGKPETVPTLKLDLLADIARTLKEQVEPVLQANSHFSLIQFVHADVQRQILELEKASEMRPGSQVLVEIGKRQKQMQSVIDSLSEDERYLTRFLEGLQDPKLRSAVIQVLTVLSKQIKKLQSFASPSSNLEIYEIVPRLGGGIEFRTVTFQGSE